MDQCYIDMLMLEIDGIKNKGKFGVNVILAVLLVCVKVVVELIVQFFYCYLGGVNVYVFLVLMMNIFNGGLYVDNSIDFQEFMIMLVGVSIFFEGLCMGVEIFYYFKNVFKDKGYFINVGDEGGFVLNIKFNQEVIEMVLIVIEKVGYKLGEEIYIVMDVVVFEFYNVDEKVYYFYQFIGDKLISFEMVDYWKQWVDNYLIFFIEDGLDEDDWIGWKVLNVVIGDCI